MIFVWEKILKFLYELDILSKHVWDSFSSDHTFETLSVRFFIMFTLDALLMWLQYQYPKRPRWKFEFTTITYIVKIMALYNHNNWWYIVQYNIIKFIYSGSKSYIAMVIHADWERLKPFIFVQI